MRKVIGYCIILFNLLLTSCLRLDNNLFNLGDKISEYKLDAYDGEQDFRLDPNYNIPDSLIHVFTLSSKLPSENEAKKIYAIYIGRIQDISSDTVIMYCHGNKWHMDFYWQRAKLLAHSGGKNRFGVMMIDYRGYGLSEGTPSEEGLYTDVDAALQWLRLNGLNNERLIMYGFSLGSAPVCELSANPRSLSPKKIILEAPFASADVMAADGSQLNMPASFFTNLEIDNAEEIKKVTQPLCWVHGDNDLFLNYITHGQLVYSNHSGIFKESHIVNDADHGEIPVKLGFQEYNKIISNFILK